MINFKKATEKVFLAGLFLTLFSCEETVHIDQRQISSRIVIEALLTDRLGKQYVKISRTEGFYDEGLTERVTTAAVNITDNLGNMMSYVHNPRQHPDSVGFYLPVSSNYVGIVERSYSLEVEVGGVVYHASDQMKQVTDLTSLKYSLYEVDKTTGKRIYQLRMYLTEPQDTKDYYFVKYYRNDSLVYNNNDDIYFADDNAIGENIDGLPSDVKYALNDKARVELYSLTRGGYVYYSDLYNILNGSGGLATPNQGNPRTNIEGGALGFFQVSAMKFLETVIK